MFSYHRAWTAIIGVWLAVMWVAGCSSSSDQPAQGSSPTASVGAPPQQAQPAAQGAQQPGPTPSGAQAAQPTQPTVPVPVSPNAAAKNISWQSLAEALPTGAPEWKQEGQSEGQGAQVGGISFSKANCTMAKDGMKAQVVIVDTSMNPALSMPFTMTRSLQLDTQDERIGPVNFGAHPGVQKLDKKRDKAAVLVMVANRILVTITVDNAKSEKSATDLAQYVNFQKLAQLAGG